MDTLLQIIKDRHSTRAPFDPNRAVDREDIRKIIEAGRWAPTAHNMQNFEIIVVDGQETLARLGEIESPPAADFIRENCAQLSANEAELKKKKTGILGTQFPPAWQHPDTIEQAIRDSKPTPLKFQIKDSPAVLVVVYDSRKRAPASAGDVLGFLSLGCMMENMWLEAHTLGIGFQIVSAFSGDHTGKEVKRILAIPNHLRIAFAVRLGFPVAQTEYLRVRRDPDDFVHHDNFGNIGY